MHRGNGMRTKPQLLLIIVALFCINSYANWNSNSDRTYKQSDCSGFPKDVGEERKYECYDGKDFDPGTKDYYHGPGNFKNWFFYPKGYVKVKTRSKVGLMAKGEGVYNTNCAGCHKKDGTGMPPIFPAIKNSAIVNGDSIANISIVLHGKSGMPTFKMLDDENLAAVITYTRNAFGNTGSTVKPSDIKSARLNYNYHSLAESNTPTTVYITNMVDIPMRSSNKIEREPSNLLKMLPSGTQLTVLSTENGWTKVKFKNTVGWIISRYLKHVGQKTYITDEVEIPMRSSNKVERDPSNLLKMLPSYTQLEILLTEDGWSKIRLDNQEGWIISRYLTSKKPEPVIPNISNNTWVYNDNRILLFFELCH